MFDEEHQFESKADAGASKTYPQQAGTICKNGYIAIKGRLCKKLVLELSAAKKDRDFYLSKVDQSKAISKIGERLKKKRKIEMVPKVVRHFPQKRPIGNEAGESKGQLARDILAGVFGDSS